MSGSMNGSRQWYLTTSGPLTYLIILMSAICAGVLTIGFIFGAYMAETFRGAIMAVDSGEMEAAKATWYGPCINVPPYSITSNDSSRTTGFLVTTGWFTMQTTVGFDYRFRRHGTCGALAAGSTKMPFTFYMTVALIFLFFTSVSTGFAVDWLNVNSVSTRGSYGLFIDNWKPAGYLSGLWTTAWMVCVALVIGLFVAIPLAISHQQPKYVD